MPTAERGAARTRRRKQATFRGWGAVAGVALIALIVGGGWFAFGRHGADDALYRFETEDIHALAFDPVEAETLFFGYHRGVKVSRNGGRAWRDSTPQSVDAMQLAFPRDDRRYIAGHNVFRVSVDRGVSWRDQATNLPSLDLHAFAASPADPLRCYVFVAGIGLFTSADGGVHWQPLRSPAGGPQDLLIAASPADSTHVFAAADRLVWESRDTGVSWRLVDGPPERVNQLAVSATGDVFAATQGGVARRIVGGAWYISPLPAKDAAVALSVAPVSAGRVVVVTATGRLYRSDDNGQTWRGG